MPSPRPTGLERREPSREELGAIYGVLTPSRMCSPESTLPGVGEYRPATGAVFNSVSRVKILPVPSKSANQKRRTRARPDCSIPEIRQSSVEQNRQTKATESSTEKHIMLTEPDLCTSGLSPRSTAENQISGGFMTSRKLAQNGQKKKSLPIITSLVDIDQRGMAPRTLQRRTQQRQTNRAAHANYIGGGLQNKTKFVARSRQPALQAAVPINNNTQLMQ